MTKSAFVSAFSVDAKGHRNDSTSVSPSPSASLAVVCLNQSDVQGVRRFYR